MGLEGPLERQRWRSWRPELHHTGLHGWPGARKTTATARSAPSIPQCPQALTHAVSSFPPSSWGRRPSVLSTP